MKSFTFIADLHLHNSYPYGNYNEEGINSRLLDIVKNLKYFVDFSIKKAVSGVYILGDIFDGDSKLLRRIFMESILPLITNNIPIIILTGNHDGDGVNFVMDDIGLFCKATKQGRLIVQNKNKIFDFENEKTSFLLIPWQLKSDIKKDLEVYKQRANKDYKHILLLHAGIDEAVMGFNNNKSDFKLNKSDFNFFDMVIGGHIHKPQDIDNKIHIVGSPAVIDFDERDEKKRFLYLEINNESKFKLEEHFFEDRKFEYIYGNDENFSDIINKKRNGDIVRIILEGTRTKLASYDKNRLSELLLTNGASKVLFKDNIIKEKIENDKDLCGYTTEQLVEYWISGKIEDESKRKEYTEYGKVFLV